MSTWFLFPAKCHGHSWLLRFTVSLGLIISVLLFFFWVSFNGNWGGIQYTQQSRATYRTPIDQIICFFIFDQTPQFRQKCWHTWTIFTKRMHFYFCVCFLFFIFCSANLFRRFRVNLFWFLFLFLFFSLSLKCSHIYTPTLYRCDFFLW